MALQLGDEQGMTRIQKTVTIHRPAADLYRFWRNFEQLPQFMDHVKAVTVKDMKHSHWVVQAPAGATVEWDAEITEELVNERIAWRTKADADIENAGEVCFRPAPGDRGTEVTVRLSYRRPRALSASPPPSSSGRSRPSSLMRTSIASSN